MKERIGKSVAMAFSGWLLLAAPAESQGVKIVGPGAATCSQYLSEVRAKPGSDSVFVAWAQGYMSGVLLRAPAGVDDALDLLPRSFPLLRQAEFLRAFCTANGSADFADAVNELYRTLRAPPG